MANIKKVLIFIIGGCGLLVFCIFSFYKKAPDFDQIPACSIMNETYFTNDPRFFEEEIPSNYILYGKIKYIVEYLNQAKGLSTNNSNYMNKEIYYDKNNEGYIYLKYDENKFLKLYTEEAKNKFALKEKHTLAK